MKVTYNWLKDFVEIKISPQALADKLTLAGLEVTSLEAKEGDFLLELEVTSNRPDCLSVIGIAREVAAVTNLKIKIQNLKSQFKIKNLKKEKADFKIEIQDKKDCPLYTAKIIRDIQVGPSPEWLKKRLELVGSRSVNNIVDITNYILFEWGAPLHGFDLDKLGNGKIIVRRAKANEKLTTIDAEEKALNPEILIIADESRPVAIAGIVGGKESEVSENTKNILLEAAVFNPILIRRAKGMLGVTSESAYRFERGVTPEVVTKASLRAAELIEQLAGGRCVLAKEFGISKTKKKAIKLGVSTVNEVLGISITQNKIKTILNSLEFKTRVMGKNYLTVTSPAHRQDINLEIELIEELARISGYGSIPTTLPKVTPQVSALATRGLVSLVKNILIGLGLNEAITYSLVDKDLLAGFKGKMGPESPIEILNPLSKEQGILRPRIIPSLSACIAHNLNQKQNYINIFEVAKVFLSSQALPKEELRLAIALCGERTLLLKQGLIKEELGFLHLKGILETLFKRLGIEGYNFKQEDAFLLSIFAHREKLGLMQRLEKTALDKLGIKNKDVLALELSLDKLFAYVKLQKRFIPLPKYPGIARDISFILKEDISIEELLQEVKEKGRPLLEDATIVDSYKGKQIPPGYRGLTISCIYRSKETTLSEAEINPLHSQICTVLVERFAAQIRS